MKFIEKLSMSAVAIMATLAVSVSGALAADKVTLRTDWTVVGYHAPFYLGLDKGFYSDEGLDLQIEEGKGSATGISLVANGRDTFTFADAATSAKMTAEGSPTEVVMGIIQRSLLSVVSPKDRNIKTPKDLIGKVVASCGSTGGSVLFPAFLDATGLNKSEVTLVNTDCSAYFPLVVQGRADATISYYPAAMGIFGRLGVHDLNSLSFWDAGVKLPAHGIVASKETADTKKDLVTRFVAATAKSWTYARANPDEAVESLMKHFPLLAGKAESLKSELVLTMQFVPPAGTYDKPFGWQSPKDWDEAIHALTTYMGMKPGTPPSSLYTNEFIKEN